MHAAPSHARSYPPPYAPAATGPAWADRTRDDAAERHAEHQALRHHAGNFLRAVLPADMAAPVRFEPPVSDYSASGGNGGKPTQRALQVQELIYEELAHQDAYADWFALLVRAAGGHNVQAEASRAVTRLAQGYGERRARQEVGL